ncbi:MAG: DUF4038 domain-containing protein [Eubacteriales bacterium]|nr:DUF4038 domain-containing protein [Eubacteriales bacterium]
MKKQLKVSENQRYLCDTSGKPFFYLGDTAWELFHRLNRKESTIYLRDRAEKGFTVIQAVVVAEIGGADEPNAQGDLPFIDKDVSKPNEKYFKHVDAVVDIAEKSGLFIGMLPTWGCHWKANERSPQLFTRDNAFAYGQWIGARYRDKPVIWIMGGDRIPSEPDKKVLEQMAFGIRKGDAGEHLITFHPIGPGQSSAHFNDVSWLDFNMIQTSHAARDHFNGEFIRRDYELTPIKPTLDGEPRYEQITVGFYNRGIARPSDRFDDFDVRQAAYWSMFSGACGHTYGNNNVWQMYDQGRTPIINADVPWHEAIHHPGARQMGYMRKFFEACHFEQLVSANEILFDAVQNGGGKTLAMQTQDESVFLVYSPFGQPFGLDLSGNFNRYKVSWFNPKYNTKYTFLETSTGSLQTYVPPTSGRGNDWVLLLERL